MASCLDYREKLSLEDLLSLLVSGQSLESESHGTSTIAIIVPQYGVIVVLTASVDNYMRCCSPKLPNFGERETRIMRKQRAASASLQYRIFKVERHTCQWFCIRFHVEREAALEVYHTKDELHVLLGCRSDPRLVGTDLSILRKAPRGVNVEPEIVRGFLGKLPLSKFHVQNI